MNREELEKLLATAIRQEIVRQYRDDERRKCPAGAHFYEEQVAPGEIARACLSSIEEAGMVVVPREPTDAMIDAGNEKAIAPVYVAGDEMPSADDCWRAMVAAALAGE